MENDTSSVVLTVLTSQKQAAEALFDRPCDGVWEYTSPPITEFQFHDVSEGNLYFLPALVAAGISYESAWEACQEYGAGTEILRFTKEGEAVKKTNYVYDLNPDIGQLMGLIDKPEELRQFIINHQEEHATLPWENQEENGKIFLTRKLIDPGK